MFLTCTQTGVKLRQVDGFYVVGRFNDGSILEVSSAIIERIPQTLRRNKECEDIEDYLGVDIYKGIGIPSEDGHFLSGRLSQGKFQFSIDRDTFEKYLGELVVIFPKRGVPLSHKA